MSGWAMLVWSAVCLAGVLLFLRTVAGELDAVELGLRILEERERRELRKRQEAAPMARAQEAA
ncbi:MAG: hypothetical protein HY763_10125 [Planctomycetes bacterium]|nr:hypothetical protein [Planctomycetota bacterium]